MTDDRLPDRGSLVAWSYGDAVQYGTVESIQEHPDGRVTAWLHRPGRRNRRGLELLARPITDLVVVLTVDELTEAARAAGPPVLPNIPATTPSALSASSSSSVWDTPS